jgi:tRNA 5-methylaminomethyl-2-thiouridine biosynthesis bifunctional protein
MTPDNAIVIGGGIAGCSTAYALAQRGIKVTLLERNPDIASEASGNPLAMLYPRLSGNDDSSQFALAGYLYSIALFKTLDLPASDFNACGMLQLGFNARELTRIQKAAADYPASSIRYVSKSEASQIAGIDIAHDALYLPEAAWVKPQRLCRRLIQHKNISSITFKEVFSLLKNKDLFEINFNDGSKLQSPLVIIANANDAQQLCPGLPLNTQAVRGQVSLLKTAAGSENLHTIICSDGYFSPATYDQDTAHLHCLGATFSEAGSTSNRAAELTLSAADHKTNLDQLHNISPGLYQDLKDNITGGRVSLRCTAGDYWPLAGQLLDVNALQAKPPRPGTDVNSLPWLDGLYINAAHGSKGFTTAPLCAELIASMVCNQPLPISAELAGWLNPNRFLLKQMGLKRLAKMAPVLSFDHITD